MGKSTKKQTPTKQGGDNLPQKKVVPTPTTVKKRRSKKKNKQQVEIRKKDLGGDLGGNTQSPTIDFSQYAAGSAGLRTPTGGTSLASISEDKEERARSGTPTVDNRQSMDHQYVAQMTDVQQKSFIPINQKFGSDEAEEEDIEEAEDDIEETTPSPKNTEEEEKEEK